MPIEATAASIVIDYWPNGVSSAVWITVLVIPMIVVNCLPVNFYGETEFVFGESQPTFCIREPLLSGPGLFC